MHVEVLADLSAGAFLNALARFQARQPGLRALWSDNATNFLKACKDLREAAEDWPKEAAEYLEMKGLIWKFAPPPNTRLGEGPMREVCPVEAGVHLRGLSMEGRALSQRSLPRR